MTIPKPPAASEPFRRAFFAALAAGIITHLFALVQPLHNYDDIYNHTVGFGAGLTSGRWFLQWIGSRAMAMEICYNMPTVNGLFFLFLLAIAAAFLVSALKIRGKWMPVLVGMLFVVFPTAASTMYFRFTAQFYGLAILFAVLAAWIPGKFPLAFLFSACFTAMSLGTYQSYTPITISIFVLILLREALTGKSDWKVLLRQGIYYCACLILGLILYFVALKLMLRIYNAELATYRGINSMGQLTLSQLPSLLKQCYTALLLLPKQDYYGMATSELLRNLYLWIGIISMVLFGYLLLFRVRNVLLAVFSIVLLLVFPVALNFVTIMCPNSGLYTLMLYGFVLCPCLPAVLCECLPPCEDYRKSLQAFLSKVTSVLLALTVFCYAYETNVSYTSLYYANRQVENYYCSLFAQVRMTEGFTSTKKWAMLGENNDPLFTSPYWGNTLKFGGNSTALGLINGYSAERWAPLYLGYEVPYADDSEIAVLIELEDVKSMPCWPDAGAIKVIGDTVVIKFQECS